MRLFNLLTLFFLFCGSIIATDCVDYRAFGDPIFHIKFNTEAGFDSQYLPQTSSHGHQGATITGSPSIPTDSTGYVPSPYSTLRSTLPDNRVAYSPNLTGARSYFINSDMTYNLFFKALSSAPTRAEAMFSIGTSLDFYAVLYFSPHTDPQTVRFKWYPTTAAYGTPTSKYISAEFYPEDDAWHMFTLVFRKEDSIKIYLDGDNVGELEITETGVKDQGVDRYIYAGIQNQSSYYDMALTPMKCLSAYNHAFSTQEVTDAFNHFTTPETAEVSTRVHRNIHFYGNVKYKYIHTLGQLSEEYAEIDSGAEPLKIYHDVYIENLYVHEDHNIDSGATTPVVLGSTVEYLNEFHVMDNEARFFGTVEQVDTTE